MEIRYTERALQSEGYPLLRLGSECLTEATAAEGRGEGIVAVWDCDESPNTLAPYTLALRYDGLEVKEEFGLEDLQRKHMRAYGIYHALSDLFLKRSMRPRRVANDVVPG